jgi:hypothetical protein
MGETKQSSFGVTADDLRRSDWQSRVWQAKNKECYGLCEGFTAAARECTTAKDDLGFRVFSFLNVVASFYPNYDIRGNPYGSMWSGFNGKRTLNAEDLCEDDLAALSGIVEEIQDPEFRARVADVLWVTKKDFKAARIAILAFLQASERLKTDDLWPPYVERLERAAQISAIRGFETERKTVVAALEAAIVEYENNTKAGLLCHHLMLALLGLKEGDAVHYAALSERLAKRFADAEDWHVAEAYWLLAEQWHRVAKKETEAQACLLAAAECNVSRGEEGLATQGAMFASYWVGRGVEALRRAKANPERIKTVHRRFLALQKQSLSELTTIKIDSLSNPEFVEAERVTQERSAAHVRGHDFQTALVRFANVTQPTDVEKLQQQHQEATKNTIFDKIAGASSIDHDGKVADTVPAAGVGNPEEEKEALRKRLCQQARTLNWPMHAVWYIEPARYAIVDEHVIRHRDLIFFVTNNPFIPPGHEGIYLRGIQAGFFGDWLTALHLLIPQVEASIRHVLNQYGIITSTLDSDGTQQERDLNQLLWIPDVERIIGANILFDLRGLLIERFGHNLRNESAHGLLPEGGFYQASSVYLWWLIVHLCWKGFHLGQLINANEGKEA